MTHYDRLPPQNLDAEKSVIGAMLLNEEAIPRAAEVLPTEAAFYSEAHRIIYKAILYLHGKEADHPDAVRVMHMLNIWGKLEASGGPAYISDLSGSVPTSANVAHYAEIVRKCYTLRQCITASERTVSEAYGLPEDTEAFLASSIEQLNQIAMGATRAKEATPKDLSYGLFAWLEKMKSMKDEVPGMTTGISQVDRYLEYGFENDIVVIGALSSVGKSSFLLNIIFNNGVRGLGGLLFTLEDGRDRTIRRMARLACPNEKFMQLIGPRGKADRYDLMLKYMGIVEAIPLMIHDDLHDIDKILHAARVAISKNPDTINYVAIDYLQIVTATGKFYNEVAKLNYIMNQITIAKKWLHPRPILLVSQMTVPRDVTPTWEMFKGSTNIGNSADIAIVLHRHPEQKGAPDYIRIRMTIGKQRDGPRVATTLMFCPAQFLFTDEDGSRDIDPKQAEFTEDELPF